MGMMTQERLKELWPGVELSLTSELPRRLLLRPTPRLPWSDLLCVRVSVFGLIEPDAGRHRPPPSGLLGMSFDSNRMRSVCVCPT